MTGVGKKEMGRGLVCSYTFIMLALALKRNMKFMKNLLQTAKKTYCQQIAAKMTQPPLSPSPTPMRGQEVSKY